MCVCVCLCVYMHVRVYVCVCARVSGDRISKAFRAFRYDTVHVSRLQPLFALNPSKPLLWFSETHSLLLQRQQHIAPDLQYIWFLHAQYRCAECNSQLHAVPVQEHKVSPVQQPINYNINRSNIH